MNSLKTTFLLALLTGLLLAIGNMFGRSRRHDDYAGYFYWNEFCQLLVQ